MSGYVACIRKYAVFAGRSSRREYWMFTLFNFLFFLVAAVLDNLFGSTLKAGGASLGYGLLYLLDALFMVLPAISVVVRRLHDVGKSDAYSFVVLIPLVGPVWILVLMCMENDPLSNVYGPPSNSTVPSL